MKYRWMALLILILSCSSKKEVATKLPMTIDQAVAAQTRTPEHRLRDPYRHPVETLKFFGVEPHMILVEIAPSAGWYMEILAPMLVEKGNYIMASPPAVEDYAIVNEKKISEWKMRNPKVASKMKAVMFNPPSDISFPEDNSADMVLTFRNVHNWVMAKGEKQAFKAFFDVLKPGGILGVVEHRADANAATDIKSGYMKEKDVIAMAQTAGFRLVEKSEINANPKDTKNHPEGVWTLPPSLRMKEKDKDKYLAIGESDRMTLKFKKPASK